MNKAVPIRSVSRSLAVLQAINRRRQATIMETANDTGLPYPTVFRLIQTLLYEGMIECEPSRKRYRPTELVRTLTLGFQDDDRLVAAARPHLMALTSRLGWPVAITVRVGSRMMVKDSTHAMTTQTFTNHYPGYTQPLLDCASGKAYVAFCLQEERDIILQCADDFDEGDHGFGRLMLRDPKVLSGIRDAGFATHNRNPHSATPGKTSSIAVPIHQDGGLLGCLALIYFAHAMPMDRALESYLGPLRACAAAISDAADHRTEDIATAL